MRTPVRSIAALLMSVVVATCSDAPTGPVPATAGPGKIALTAVFSTSAALARLADFGITVDHIRIVVVRAPADTVKDTTLVFTPGQPDVALDLAVALHVPNETFTGIIELSSVANGLVLRGSSTVQARAAGQPAPVPQPITITYVGAGATDARIVVAPKTVTLVGLAGQRFTVTAVDGANAPVTIGPVHWTTSDASVATISGAGQLQPTGKRGTVTVTAITLTNITDSATATLALPATGIAIVSGAGQTGQVGTTLAAQGVVRVIATDGLGVPGITVLFAAPVGGSVGTSSVVTDAAGLASTSLTLGTAGGAQSFAAAAGSFSVAIPETATAGDPATIVAVSGGGQRDLVRRTLQAPLIALVSDAFGNPVSNVIVAWTRVGTGSLSAASTPTGADGRASVAYTLGNTVGSETITASAAGKSVTFIVQALAEPAAIVAVSGGGQTGRVLQTLGAPFVVKVTDDAGNVMSGVTVTWSATNGTLGAATTTTDGAGLSSNVMTLGSGVGGATATATIAPGKAATFASTVQSGIVAKIVFRTSPSGGIVNAALVPVQVELQDAGGNATTAVNAVTIALVANANGAVLGGTLTRNAVGGVATFDNLTLDKIGTYSLTASSANVASITSAAFTVAVPSSATQLLLVPATPTSFTLQAGVAPVSQPVVKTADANGTAVTNVPVHTALARSSNPQQILNQQTLNSDASGIVSGILDILGSPPTSAGVYTITVTSPSIPSASIALTVTVQPAVASKLVITTQPASAAVSGAPLAPQPVVQVEDTFGNAVSAAAQITATPSTGSASGNVVSANGTTGAAAFSSLTLVGNGSITLTVSATGLQSATSTAIAMSNTLPTQLTLVPASPTSFTYQAGVPPTAPPSFKVADAGGVAVANISVRVVTQTSVPATVQDVTLTSDANGLVVVTGNLPTLTGNYTITATSPAISGASVVVSVAMTAGPATKLAFTGATTGYSASAGQPITTPAIVVAVEDQFSNVVTTSVAPVAVAITAGTGAIGAVLSGTSSVVAASGVATFTNLSLNRPSSTYTLTATTSGLTSAVSLPITIVTGQPAQLVFLSQPTAALPGAAVPSFVIQLLDQSGNATTGTNSVTLSVASGTAGAVLSGASVNAVNGIATFSAFTIDREGTYTISAAGTGLTATTSNSFLIFNEHAMAFVQTPSATQTNGFVLSPQPTMQLNDGTTGLNPVRKAGVVITASVLPAPGSTGGIPNSNATFSRSGTFTATTDANGLATFTNLGILSTQGGLTGRVTFSATSGTTQTIAAITTDVLVNAGAPTTMQRSTSLIVSTTVGTALPVASWPTVRLLDVGGSPVPNASGVSIVFSVVGGNCSPTSGTVPTTDANGLAVIPNLTLPVVAGSCLVRATTAPSLTGSPIDFDIVVGPAGGSIWLGATDNDFANGLNWRSGAAPGSGANMFIPTFVPNSPRVAAPTTIGSLAIEAGASFTVAQDVLTINGTTAAGVGSIFTVSGGAGAKALFHGVTTTLGNLTVAARTVQFDNSATITGNVVATDTATIKHTGANRVLTIAGSLTASTGSTLSGLTTVKFTGSTFPAYGNATTAGTPLITQISGNMSVPSGVSSFVNNLLVSDAALSVNGNGTTLTAGGDLDVKSSTGASGEILMNSGDPTLVVSGVAIFEGKAQNGQGLTAGTLDLRGDFIQRDRTAGSHGEFEPGPLPFIVKFTGGGSGQSVFFDHPGTSPGTESYFTNVLVVNQGGVTQSSHAYINGGIMTVGGSPADPGSPAMWSTGIGGSSLFITGGSSLLVRQSGQFTVTAGGSLDLTGGSCSTFAGPLVQGNVVGGSCTTDPSLLGSVGMDHRFAGQFASLR